MKKKVLAASLLATALAAVVPAAQATDLLFLKNSPASKFTAADFKLLRANLEKALAGPPDGPALDWKNDKTGASGTVHAGRRGRGRGAEEVPEAARCQRLQAHEGRGCLHLLHGQYREVGAQVLISAAAPRGLPPPS